MCTVVAAYWAMAAMTAASAYSSTQTQKATSEYEASVARNNQKTAQWQAADAEARGNAAAADTRRKYAAMAGAQRAALAAGGLSLADGSANAIMNDTAFFGAVDEERARYNGQREAWGYQVRASNFGSQAAASQAAADAANPLLSAGMAAGRSLLGSYAGGGVADRWYQQAGAWDAGGFNGTNDRSWLTIGDKWNAWGTYGGGGD
ncbi:MAG: hypothetical protein QM702_25175 [Rubrivivax sp.]